jgi:hypothetical protein
MRLVSRLEVYPKQIQSMQQHSCSKIVVDDACGVGSLIFKDFELTGVSKHE